MANTLRGISQVCGLMNNEADATSKLSRGAKAESTRIGVGIIETKKEQQVSIDPIRLEQPMRCHRLENCAYGNQKSQVTKQPMCHHRL
jgi:hypothetical protein